MNKKNKNILILTSVLVFAAFLVWLVSTSDNSSNAVAESSQGSLAGSDQDFDFGTIGMQDGNVEHEFEVKNESEEVVVISKVYTSCACTTAYIYDAKDKKYGEFGMQGHGYNPFTEVSVNPGESAIVKAIFNPAKHGPAGVGLAQRSVYVETNSAKSPKMEFSFSAMVTK